VKSKILYGKEAREKILKGMETMYRVVATTLGPRGNNVCIDKGFETLTIHDGFRVAESVKLTNPYEKIGADILLQSAKKQVEEVGDGTTLTIILARSLAYEANKIVAAGVNAMSLRDGLEKLRDEVIDKIKQVSIPIYTKEQKIQVATISSANKDLGDMIGTTIHKIGADGVSTVEESHSRDTTVDMQEGLQIDQGWRLPHFITNPEDETAVLEGARILVTDMVLSDFTEEIQPFLIKELIPNGKTLFVIAQDYEGNVLPSFVVNKMNGKLNVLCVQAPLFENIQKALLTDMAILTGATVIGEDTGVKLKDIKFEHLGYAEKVKSTKDATIITGGKGNKKDIEVRIKSIRKQIDESESSFDIAKLQERLAKLTGSVAVIKVGGATEVEMRERKERVEDAVEATKTATRSGVVAGGEITLLNIALSILRQDSTSTIMRNALQSPFRKLLENAGLDAGEYKEILKDKDGETGLNIITGEICNMIKEGIVDPTEVLTSAVYNATSVAMQVITSEAIIPHIEEKK
jgi:chaperonin GroEL